MVGIQVTYDDDEAMRQLQNGQLLVEYDDKRWYLGDSHRKLSARLRARLLDQGRLEEVGRFQGRRHYRLRVPGTNP